MEHINHEHTVEFLVDEVWNGWKKVGNLERLTEDEQIEVIERLKESARKILLDVFLRPKQSSQ